MSNNSSTIEKQHETRVARPFNELVSELKTTIREMEEAAETVTEPYQIKCGETLLEIRGGYGYGGYRKALSKVYVSLSTAGKWERLAHKNAKNVIDWEKTTMSKQSGDHRPFARVDPEVTKRVEEARRHMEEYAKHEHSRREERTAEYKLALRLIDIGYKILSKELHPDKRGGSTEAMRRLNAVRARLKKAA